MAAAAVKYAVEHEPRYVPKIARRCDCPVLPPWTAASDSAALGQKYLEQKKALGQKASRTKDEFADMKNIATEFTKYPPTSGNCHANVFRWSVQRKW